jgi:hypothetical protein
MKTITDSEKNTTEAISDEVITSPMLPGVVIRPLREAVRHQVIEGIPELRALRQEILASRGGRPISLQEIVGAQH